MRRVHVLSLRQIRDECYVRFGPSLPWSVSSLVAAAYD